MTTNYVVVLLQIKTLIKKWVGKQQLTAKLPL